MAMTNQKPEKRLSGVCHSTHLSEHAKCAMMGCECDCHSQIPYGITFIPAQETPSIPPILSQAAALITGPRRESYGPVEESFTRLAAAYNIVLHRKLKEPLTAHDAAMLGVALKLCRESVKPSLDNRTDLIGYTALAEAVAPKEEVS
jgi:hypothetical protein